MAVQMPELGLLPSLPAPEVPRADASGEELAQQFERILLSQAFKSLRATAHIAGEESFLSGPECDTWLGLLDQELTDRIASSGRLGMSRALAAYGEAESLQAPARWPGGRRWGLAAPPRPPTRRGCATCPGPCVGASAPGSAAARPP